MKLRALLRIGLLALATAILASCGTLYAPRLEGRLLDAETREPVADAHVFTSLELQGPSFGEPNMGSTSGRWTTTDGEGYFVFERMLVDRWFRYYHTRVLPKPSLLLVDRRYGAITLHLPDGRALWTELSFEVSPNSSLDYFEDPIHWSSLCTGWDRDSCMKMCLIAYQDRKACEYHIPEDPFR